MCIFSIENKNFDPIETCWAEKTKSTSFHDKQYNNQLSTIS